MIGHSSAISGVASSGGLVATAGYDNKVILWDAESRRPLAVGTHDHLVNQCAFNTDASRLVTSSSDYSARLWSVPDMRLLRVFGHHDDDVEMAAFSPDGDHVVTASRDRKIRIFDLGGSLIACFVGHGADVISVVWTPDGRNIISSGDDGTVRWWDVATQEAVRTFEMEDAETDTIAILDNGALAAGNDRGEVFVLCPGKTLKYAAHTAGVKRIQFDRRTRHLVSTSYDRQVKVWSCKDGELHFAYETTAPAPVWLRSFDFSERGALLFGTFGGGYASFEPASARWDLELYRTSPCVNAALSIGGDAFSVGDAGNVRVGAEVISNVGSLCNFLKEFGGRVLTGGQLGVLFDGCTGATIYRHHSPLNCAASDSDTLYVGTYTGEVLSFDGSLNLTDRRRVHTNAVKGLAYSDGVLFSVSATGACELYDVKNSRPIKFLDKAHDKIANGACVVRGTGFASVSRDLQLRLWSLAGELVARIPTPHAHSIKCVAADEAGTTIATGSYDGGVGFLEMRSGSWNFIRPTTAGISSLSFDRTQEKFLVSSYDGTVMWADGRGTTCGRMRGPNPPLT